MEYKLRYEGDPILGTVCDEVPHGEDTSELVAAMWEVMYSNKGVGLSANQVGSTKRVVVLDVEGVRLAVINPKLIIKNPAKCPRKEGCLSYPGKTFFTRRYKRVALTGFDLNWKPIKVKLKSWGAVCAQHEIDHLNGKVV